MGLNTAEDIETDEFRAYWTDNSREIATKADLSDYWSRIAFDGDFLGQAPKKVTATDLFYLRNMDEGTCTSTLPGPKTMLQRMHRLEDYFKKFELEFPAIVYKDTLKSEPEVSSEPTVSPHNVKKVDFDFTISFAESNDEDYTFIYDKNSSSYNIISVNDLKLDTGNDNG
ncbi:hypothetical protein Tco_1467051 [Tanacetum coccineum]